MVIKNDKKPTRNSLVSCFSIMFSNCYVNRTAESYIILFCNIYASALQRRKAKTQCVVWPVSGWSSAGREPSPLSIGPALGLAAAVAKPCTQRILAALTGEEVPRSCLVACCTLSCREHERIQKLWGQYPLEWAQAEGAQRDNVPGFSQTDRSGV